MNEGGLDPGMLSKEQVEFLHKRGKIPDKYYYQMNGNSAQANYESQKEKIISQNKAPLIEIDEKELNSLIQDTIQGLIENLKIDF